MSWIPTDNQMPSFRVMEANLKALDTKLPVKNPDKRFPTCTREDFGNWDFEVFTSPSQAIIMPVSKAALYFLEDEMNGSETRHSMKGYTWPGFVVKKSEWRYMEPRLEDVGLVSKETYDMAMEELHEQFYDDRPIADPEDG